MDEGVVRARGRGIVKALRRIGDETGSPITMDSKEARIRLQKVVYLLKAGGYPPAQKFEFNIYQNGPYSPGLTEVYYLYANSGISEAAPAQDIPGRLIEAIRDADAKGIQFLEALTTTLDTTASLRKQGVARTGMGSGLTWARSIKPNIDEATWRGVREFLRAHTDFAGST